MPAAAPGSSCFQGSNEYNRTGGRKMCGIIGYVGRRPCKDLLLAGLERLEYRGYDSAGIALLADGTLEYTRAVGPLAKLKESAARVDASAAVTGLGHTRWATHGAVTEANAHPLTGCDDAEARHRPQRHRRELPRAEGRPRGRRAHVLLRDRRRDRLAPDRALLHRRPRRGRLEGVPGDGGPFHLRRDPRRPSPTCSSARGTRRRSSSASAKARRSWPPTPPPSSPRRAASTSPPTGTSSRSRPRA